MANDTAYDLGKELARGSVCGVKNPFDPDSTDYDDFNEGLWLVRKEQRETQPHSG